MIYNPFAGTLQRNPKSLARAAAILEQDLGPVRLVPTRGPETAGRIAQESIASGAEMIVVAGGDGTINEVLHGAAGSDVPLGILPFGTANVLAMEMKLGGNPLRVASALRGCQVRRVALGRMTAGGQARYVLLMAGIGLDASIVRGIDPKVKRVLGKLSYWIGGFSQIGRTLPEFEVTAGGRTFHSSFLLASRVKNYGGDLEIARHADLLRDDFALVSFAGPSTYRYLKYFSGVLLNRLKGMQGVEVLRAQSFQVRPLNGREIDIQLDGEYAGLAPASFDIVPSAVSLLVPPAFLRRPAPAQQAGVWQVHAAD